MFILLEFKFVARLLNGKRKWNFNRFQLIDFLPLHASLFRYYYVSFVVAVLVVAAVNAYHHLRRRTGTLHTLYTETSATLHSVYTLYTVHCTATILNLEENPIRKRLCLRLILQLLSSNEWWRCCCFQLNIAWSSLLLYMSPHFILTTSYCDYILPRKATKICDCVDRGNHLKWTPPESILNAFLVWIAANHRTKRVETALKPFARHKFDWWNWQTGGLDNEVFQRTLHKESRVNYVSLCTLCIAHFAYFHSLLRSGDSFMRTKLCWFWICKKTSRWNKMEIYCVVKMRTDQLRIV